MKTELDSSKSNETVHNRSSFETVGSVSAKASDLKQNRSGYCCRHWSFALIRVTVSRLGPEIFGGN